MKVTLAFFIDSRIRKPAGRFQMYILASFRYDWLMLLRYLGAGGKVQVERSQVFILRKVNRGRTTSKEPDEEEELELEEQLEEDEELQEEVSEVELLLS